MVGVFSTAMSQTARNHFLQHLGLPNSSSLATPWKLVWFTTIWYLWKHRNAIIFKNSSPDVDEVINLVKIKSWLWLKFKFEGTNFNFSDWCIDAKSSIQFVSLFTSR